MPPAAPKAPPKTKTIKKTLTAPNLALLGAERLAELLVEVAGSDANWRRRLRLELAAEIGAPELALELDKRMDALAVGKGKVSWRKRPELIEDLEFHRRLIVERLSPLDARLGLERMVAWFDLYPGLEIRVRDPKGELAERFLAAADDLAALAAAAGPKVAAPILSEALQTRLSDWAKWIGRAAPSLPADLAEALLSDLLTGRPPPTGRLALVVRKLADRAADAAAFADTFDPEHRTRPEVGAEIARRFVRAGQPAEARAALEAARPRSPAPSRWNKLKAPPEPELSEPWQAAEIAVLDAEGRAEDAQAARWAAFERSLDPEALRAFVSRLADFDDVEALDRAFAHAAAWPDPMPGLDFLMTWPALPEAARMITARADALRGGSPHLELWAGRLARFPAAALILLRARASALARSGPGFKDEVAHLLAEAEALGEQPGLPSHGEFVKNLRRY